MGSVLKEGHGGIRELPRRLAVTDVTSSWRHWISIFACLVSRTDFASSAISDLFRQYRPNPVVWARLAEAPTWVESGRSTHRQPIEIIEAQLALVDPRRSPPSRPHASPAAD